MFGWHGKWDVEKKWRWTLPNDKKDLPLQEIK